MELLEAFGTAAFLEQLLENDVDSVSTLRTIRLFTVATPAQALTRALGCSLFSRDGMDAVQTACR